ncbi:hypothetical protein HKD37_12G034142 [Glycine soja]
MHLWTWNEVVEKFLKKYFLKSKTVEGKVEISSFHQHRHESLSEALDHFHRLLQKTPTHGFSKPVQLNIFIDGLQSHFKLKTPEEAMELIENMAANDHAILRDRAYMPTKKSLLELTSQDAMLAQNKLLAKTLEILTTTLSNLPQELHVMQHSTSLLMHIEKCNICGGTHESGSCMVQEDASNEVNYMGSHNHQGFHQGGPPGLYQRDNFLQDHDWRSYSVNNYNQGAIRNLEVQLARLVAERPIEIFGVSTEMNPKEECKVIFPGREEKEKKTEEDVRDEEGVKKEERERNKEKVQQ